MRRARNSRFRHRRDRLQVVAEVEEEHDLVLSSARGLVRRGRANREPLAVGVQIVRVGRAQDSGRPSATRIRGVSARNESPTTEYGANITLPWLDEQQLARGGRPAGEAAASRGDPPWAAGTGKRTDVDSRYCRWLHSRRRRSSGRPARTSDTPGRLACPGRRWPCQAIGPARRRLPWAGSSGPTTWRRDWRGRPGTCRRDARSTRPGPPGCRSAA